MNNKQTLGELIEKEVRKQGLTITGFAREINCERNNVYDIFKRTSIDVELLGRISKALNHNFFKDVAENLDLVEINQETDEERERRMAVNQLFEVVPRILKKMKIDAIINFSSDLEIENTEVPDFLLVPYGLAFTIGQYYKERVEETYGDMGSALVFQPFTSPNGTTIYIMTNNVHGTQTVDIKLDYKTEEEWENLLRFTFDTISNEYFPRTWNFINENRIYK